MNRITTDAKDSRLGWLQHPKRGFFDSICMIYGENKDLLKARCLVCGATFYLDINGDWHCPVCGAYDGNGHIEWLEV